ncbi:MAG TPA: AMP-binding protein [Jiangellales bacterium]|nr:AMP-binding protein [Jiangellales bacterium]
MSVETVPDTAAVPFAAALEEFGDRPALITADAGGTVSGGMTVSYRELARRADEIGERLGSARVVRAARDERDDGSGRRRSVRRLVLVAAANDVDTVVGYLAALRYGHPVLLVPRDADAIEAMTRAYAPDVILHGREINERHPTTAHTLHPDLTLLLSTSGSTGSPKLVRLSRDNLQSNAQAIATYLDIRPGDRAASTLPLYYCYGLSVLHSHLIRGAAMILTDRSVADHGFWELFRRERGTGFAAVPYTFDLLDRVGFADMDLPDLRYVTQAGGRLEPDRVRRYARLGESRCWDLFVMYGQTEATARMAYLPPHLAESAPDAIGLPIPDGSFRIVPDPDDRTSGDGGTLGELVYHGPNVMLGYAEKPADLGLGRIVDELYTGDLARLGDDGLYRIVGRRSRFLKLFGLRVDLHQVESRLAGHGVTAFCAGDDQTLVVAVEAPHEPADQRATVRRLVTEATGLPTAAISVQLRPRIPRLASGKPDYPAIARLARMIDPAPSDRDSTLAAPTAATDPIAELVRLYAATLDRDDVTPGRSFVDLGGDSLSYVETSIRLEQLLGTLPPNWHVTSIADLAATYLATNDPGADAAGPRRRHRMHMVDTSVLLRAVAIVFVVGTHIQLFGIPGGAHMLLGVAGYNFARFQLTDAVRGERVRSVTRSLGRIVVASVTWIALVMLLTDQYTLANIFLVNNVVGTVEDRYTWHFWYIEDLVYVIVAITALLSVGVVDRWERRWPFALPVAVMAIGLIARYQLIPGVELHKTTANAWLFAIGWAGAKASSRGQRILLTAATVATIPGFFDDPVRESVMIAGLVLLLWVPTLPTTRLVAVVAGALASASLYIYLVHWQIYPHLWEMSKPLALVVSLAAGILYAALFAQLAKRTTKHCAQLAKRTTKHCAQLAKRAAGYAAPLLRRRVDPTARSASGALRN